jgi:ribosomal protein S12 methylthiotransferase accessory factor
MNAWHENALARAIPELIDPIIGIISYAQEMPKEPGTPQFFHFSAQAANTAAFAKHENFRNTGGASVDRDRALLKAVGESVERYCSAIYEVEDFPLGAAADSLLNCIEPSALALFAPEQYSSPDFPWVPFDYTTRVRWFPARDILNLEIVSVPACMVLLPYFFYADSGDSPITQPISTGLACHTSTFRATIGAACEVIERDAFTITWQRGCCAPKILPETLPDDVYDLVMRFQRCNAKVSLFNITTDIGVPCILAVLQSLSAECPALAFAAAASLNARDAACKSLEELAHTRRYMDEIKSRFRRLDPDPSYSNIVDQGSHLNFWCYEENAHLAAWLFDGDVRITFESIESLDSGDDARDLRTLGERLRGVGYSLLASDLTTPDVRDLGLHVVRATIPGLHPLYMGHGIRALGGKRLWSVPESLGRSCRFGPPLGNPAPHPFP